MALNSVTSRSFLSSGLQGLPIRKKFKVTHERPSLMEQPLDFSVKSNESANPECLQAVKMNEYQEAEIEMNDSNVLNLSSTNLSNHYGWSKVQQQVKAEPQYSQQFSTTGSAQEKYDSLMAPYMSIYSSPPVTRQSTCFSYPFIPTASTPRSETVSKMSPIVEVHNSANNNLVGQQYVHECCPMNSYPSVSGIINAKTGGKSTRPFKAYPRDPLAISYGICNTAITPEIAATGALINQASNEAYIKFREQMLESVRSTLSKKTDAANKNSSTEKPTTSGDEKPKYKQETSSDDNSSSHEANAAELDKISEPEKKTKGCADSSKDQSYWERRRKNNEAAKRSRDARRAKEDEIAIRAAFLEQENVKLRMQIAILQDEIMKLRSMM